MIQQLFHAVYVLDLWIVALLIPALILLWSGLGFLLQKNMKWVSALAAILFLALVLYRTIFSRVPDVMELRLIPFSSFARAQTNREVYRSMLMNVFLFVPQGLSLPFVLRGTAAKRLWLTALIAFTLSASIEAIQFAFSLGMVETDDVLCNTVGAALGACAYPISLFWNNLTHNKSPDKAR